ncbi:MAG: putative rane protein [Blastocatellia bacterium]|jgi:putative membrane protein|nr:putative rane protein [Blastocatellia bacterium]
MLSKLYLLPHLNAFLNTTSAILLLSGYRYIRQRRIREHRNCQVSALVTSTLFLISYLTYHYYHGETQFLGQGLVRPFYFTVLISHVVLAIVIVPLVVLTTFRAARGNFAGHRQIARWTFPLWVYVSVTGVIVYVMLYHAYPSL